MSLYQETTWLRNSHWTVIRSRRPRRGHRLPRQGGAQVSRTQANIQLTIRALVTGALFAAPIAAAIDYAWGAS